tara:strand:- start:47 stop:955 length:909 start_codon:yes stop_codon:yes gene_type:complete
MSDTWNDGATTFTSIKMDVTDTASASGSLLMDLQVGGASQFSVNKAGRLKVAKVWTLSDEPFSAESFALGSSDSASIKGVISSGQLGFSVGTKYYLGSKNNAFEMGTAVALGWSASPGSGHGSGTLGGDLYLFRDAANTLAQRNSTNAQTFNLYNTYTDASNYERGFMKWNSNVLEIGTEAAGTGSNRVVRLTGGNQVELRHSYNRAISVQAAGIYVWSGPGSSALSGFVNSELRLSTGSLGFSSGNVTTASDAGLDRESAGVVKVTNGSTGTGELIFIVPTTDPGITGALWNNAGTLSIST